MKTKSKAFLSNLGIPLMEPPEGIEDIINLPTDNFLCISDAEIALGMQHKLSQFICYVRQQYNVNKSSLSRATDAFDDRLNITISDMPKSLTVKEKTMRALAQDEKLKTIHEEMSELKSKVELLSEWDSKLELLHDVTKQIYYRLRSVDYRHE